MYTKKQFGKELKNQLLQHKRADEIGRWAYTIYMQHIHEIDLDFRDLLLTLNTMEDGPEFEFSYDELNIIANKLMTGEQVKL